MGSDGEMSDDDVGFSIEDGVWEARTASMALVNALTNCPESLEDRVLLREEFGRRGLNEVIVVCTIAGVLKDLIQHVSTGATLHQASRFSHDSVGRLYRRKV